MVRTFHQRNVQLRLLDAMEIEVEEIDRQLLRERSSLSGVYIDGMKPDPKSSGTTFSQFGTSSFSLCASSFCLLWCLVLLHV